MRIYVKKRKEGFVIYKETLMQSIVSDLVTMLVIILLIGLDILFSIYVTHSVVIDIVVVLLLVFYLTVMGNKKEEIKTRDELIEIINEISE